MVEDDFVVLPIRPTPKPGLVGIECGSANRGNWRTAGPSRCIEIETAAGGRSARQSLRLVAGKC